MGGNPLGLLVLVAPFLLSEGERGKERAGQGEEARPRGESYSYRE